MRQTILWVVMDGRWRQRKQRLQQPGENASDVAPQSDGREQGLGFLGAVLGAVTRLSSESYKTQEPKAAASASFPAGFRDPKPCTSTPGAGERLQPPDCSPCCHDILFLAPLSSNPRPSPSVHGQRDLYSESPSELLMGSQEAQTCPPAHPLYLQRRKTHLGFFFSGFYPPLSPLRGDTDNSCAGCASRFPCTPLLSFCLT